MPVRAPEDRWGNLSSATLTGLTGRKWTRGPDSTTPLEGLGGITQKVGDLGDLETGIPFGDTDLRALRAKRQFPGATAMLAPLPRLGTRRNRPSERTQYSW